MLPEYSAMAVSQLELAGGSTKPCILEVEDEQGNAQGFYVVKIFENEGELSNPTLNEALTYILAKEFELPIPKAAIIDVPDFLIQGLGKVAEAGYYFGTELLEETFEINLKQLEIYQLETLFAFDLLVCNSDRRSNNPNLLSVKDDFYLIDHEKAFAGLNNPTIDYRDV